MRLPGLLGASILRGSDNCPYMPEVHVSFIKPDMRTSLRIDLHF